MLAIEIKTPGGPDALVASERPRPVPAAGEVLVKVAAAGVNRPDVMQRMGHYPPPPGITDIPGLEIAGGLTLWGSASSPTVASPPETCSRIALRIGWANAAKIASRSVSRGRLTIWLSECGTHI